MADLVFDNDGDPLGSFEQGVDWAIGTFAQIMGLDLNDFSWDAATEEWEGDVRAVMHNALTAAFGDDWQDLLKKNAKLKEPE